MEDSGGDDEAARTLAAALATGPHAMVGTMLQCGAEFGRRCQVGAGWLPTWTRHPAFIAVAAAVSLLGCLFVGMPLWAGFTRLSNKEFIHVCIAVLLVCVIVAAKYFLYF